MIDPDLLLEGSLDLHAHGSPEFTLTMPGRVDNVEWARLAAQSRMRGFVIKSHIFPTTGLVNAIAPLFPQLAIFSSITLNPTAGGLSPVAVELAIEAGAKIVWFPTWSARQPKPHRSIFLERMEPRVRSLNASYWPAEGLTVLGEDGRLKPEVHQILDICAERNTVIASGHLPIAASILICEQACARGVKFVLTHPLNPSVDASIEQQKQIASMGGYIEHVFIGCMPMHQRMDPHRIVDAIGAIGAEHCVMSTDSIESWNPPEPEIMRMYIATLLSLGITDNEVYLMTHDNPADILDLEREWSAPASLAAIDRVGGNGEK